MTEEVNSPETAWPVGSWHKEPRSPTHPHAQQSKTHLPVSSSMSLPTATTGLKPELSLAAWCFLSVLKIICHLFLIQQGSEELVTPQLGEPACLNKSKRGFFFFPDTPQSAETQHLPWLFWSPAQLLLPSSPLQLHLSSSRNKNVHRTVFFRYNTHCMGLFRVIAFLGAVCERHLMVFYRKSFY